MTAERTVRRRVAALVPLLVLVCVPAPGLAEYLSSVDGAVHIGEVIPGTGAVVIV